MALVACLTVIGAAGTYVATTHDSSRASGEASTAAAPNAPITLPASVAGLQPQAKGDPTQTSAWLGIAKRQGAGAVIIGRSYGAGGTAKSIRVVAGRTDLTGKLELAWAADAGAQVGSARCTNNTRINEQSKPRVRPTIMLCWRTSPTLSVYSLVIDPRAKTPVGTAEAAAAVDAAWQIAAHVG